jgi:lipopolysaccharide assembly outer membrane protein LptD (OstA)
MRRFLLFMTLMFSLGGVSRAQFGSFGDKPVEITSDGDTRFENGTAVADNNVQIRYGGVAIYTDHAEYNPDTRDILLLGNVRIYSGEDLFNGQRALYNLETKQVRALEFDGAHGPVKFSSLSAKGFGTRQFMLNDSDITTSDSSMPDWHVKAKTIRIYMNDRVVMLNSTLYVGKVPVFWLPYAYGNFRNQGLQYSPGYDSQWGGYLLTSYTFPLGTGDNIMATLRQDYRNLHGYAVGFDANLQFGKNNMNTGKFISYYANDTDPSAFKDAYPAPTNPSRYRVGYQGRLFLADDIYATFDITKLSDANFMQDFYPIENQTNPQPDNNVALTKLDDVYSLSLVTRWQMNNFQETTQRKPEAAFDFKQEPLFGLPVFYDGTTALGQLNRSFSNMTNSTGTTGLNYGATRFDTFHQISAPQTLWGWLSTVPKIGIRGTFYNEGGYFQGTNSDINTIPFGYTNSANNNLVSGIPAGNALHSTGNVFRPIFNAGLENSFKISQSFEGIQSRWLGLDGLRHVFQPYSNLSYVYAGGPNVNQVLQFDRLQPNNPAATTKSGYQPSSTQLEPLDFPQFGAIDTIDTWAIWRLGARNRLQTRRDGDTHDWFFFDTFADVNAINPYFNGPISNLNNRCTFVPVSWLNFGVGSQVPLTSYGFTELNTEFTVMPVRNFSFNFGTRYINNYNGSSNDNQYPFGAFLKVNDHWSLSAQEIYNQANTGALNATTTSASGSSLIYQRYMIHRDLSSWIVSFGAEVRANQAQGTTSAQNQYGALLSFTLKDLPQVALPLAFSAAQQAGSAPLSASGQ